MSLHQRKMSIRKWSALIEVSVSAAGLHRLFLDATHSASFEGAFAAPFVQEFSPRLSRDSTWLFTEPLKGGQVNTLLVVRHVAVLQLF